MFLRAWLLLFYLFIRPLTKRSESISSQTAASSYQRGPTAAVGALWPRADLKGAFLAWVRGSTSQQWMAGQLHLVHARVGMRHGCVMSGVFVPLCLMWHRGNERLNAPPHPPTPTPVQWAVIQESFAKLRRIPELCAKGEVRLEPPVELPILFSKWLSSFFHYRCFISFMHADLPVCYEYILALKMLEDRFLSRIHCWYVNFSF